MRPVLFALLVLLAGCNDTPAPTAPSPPPPTTAPAITFLRIDATSIGLGTQAALTVGATHQLIARGSLAGGGLIDVIPVWQVDNRSVVSIDANGRISAIANGSATVIATYSGVTATLVVHAATDFGGTWMGTWRLIRCDAPQVSFCAQQFPAGSTRPLTLSVIMDRIFAVVRFSWDLNGNSVMLAPSVSVDEDGALSFGGRMFDGRGFEAPVAAASWRAQLTGPDSLRARMTLIHGLVDGARTEWEVVDATRRRE